jgi:hypothetical protein
MNFFNWLGRLLYGLPLYDSKELIEAKQYKPYCSCICDCDYEEENSSLFTSEELEKEAALIYAKLA